MNIQNTTHNLIDTFYTAFQNLDAKGMIACYHDDIKFTDPAFGRLIGTDAKIMWQMLIDSQKGKDFKIYFDSVFSDQHTGTAHWEVKYVFSKTGRFVHNKIEAQFKFKDHLIVEHKDHFSLHHWAQQAFGLKGWFIGGTPFFKRQLQHQTRAMLSAYQKKAEL